MSFTETLWEMRQGESKEVRLTVVDQDGAVIDLANVTKAWLTLKKRVTDTDANAVMQLTTGGGGLTIVSPTTGGQIDALPTAAALTATAALSNARKFRLAADWKLKLSDGRMKYPKAGIVVVHPAATEATV